MYATLLLVSSLARAQPAVEGGAAPAGPDTLAERGEDVAGAVVLRVERHSEFQRYHLSLPDGRTIAPVELVEKPLGRQGVCAAHDLTLFPRWELQGAVPDDPWIEGERDPATPEEEVHRALCERLAARGATIQLDPASGEADPPEAGGGQRSSKPQPYLPVGRQPLFWLHLVLAPLVLLAGWLGLRAAWRLDRGGRRDLLLVAGLSVAARLLLSPRVLFNGALASYEKVVLAWGWSVPAEIYGGGWPALMGPLHGQLGLHPRITMLGNGLLAAVAPVALWAALRLLGRPAAARLAGLLLAVLPLHLLLSTTEIMLIPAVSLALLALAAAARSGLAGGSSAGALAGLAAGFAVHVRPEALLVLPGIALAPFAAGGRDAWRRAGPWLALLLGGGLVGMRLLELPPLADAAPMQPGLMASPGWWLSLLLPGWMDRSSPIHLVLDASWTSPLLWLGILALGLRAPGRWRAALPLLAWLPGTVLLLAKSWPLADAMRLQLVAAPAWVGLAAIGLDGLWTRFGSRAAPVAALPPAPTLPAFARPLAELGAVLLVALPLTWQRLDLLRHDEWRLWAEVVPTLPADTVLRFDDGPRRSDDFGSVLLSLNPDLELRGSSTGPARDGELLLVGASCLERPVVESGPVVPSGCQELGGRCTLTPVIERRVGARTDLDSRLPESLVDDGQVTLGIYRLEGCGG